MRRLLFGLAFPTLLLVYIGCGGADAESDGGSSTRKGSTSKGKGGKGGTGGTAGKGGTSGDDLPAGTGGTGSGGEFEIEQQEPDTCSHDACDPGLPLPEACSSCVASICAAEPSCCLEHWDDTCTHLARSFDSCQCAEGGLGTGTGGSSATGAGGSTSTGSGGASTSNKGGTGGSTSSGGSSSTSGPSCSHTPCEAGGPLKTKCSLCAAQVCAQNASCCQTDWGQPCLEVAANTPGCSCAPGTGSGGTSGSGASGGATGSGASAGSTGSGANGSGASAGSTGSGANGSGANGSGASAGSTGSGANGSGATGGSTGSGANGSGANGSGANGSGANGSGANGSGANGSGANGSGATGGSTGAGSDSGSAGGAGWLEGGSGGASASCHSPCEEGDALAKSCGLIPFGICLYDPFCCDSANGSWNESCVGYATKLFLCPKKDGDTRDDTAACEHDVCAIGKALRADCDDCTAKVCAGDSYCCDTTWDGLCLGKASELCGKCTEGKEGTCEHSACAVGAALKTGCTECVTTVCQKDPACCTDTWDAHCAGLGAEECECGKTCDHEPCVEGTALSKSCSEGTKAVCADDPYCCTASWDILCVDAAGDKGACGDKCSHDVCKTGPALHVECGDCEKKICELDPSCCDFSNGWDLVCTSEVDEVCGKTCEN
jgi:hypothetical protein